MCILNCIVRVIAIVAKAKKQADLHKRKCGIKKKPRNCSFVFGLLKSYFLFAVSRRLVAQSGDVSPKMAVSKRKVIRRKFPGEKEREREREENGELREN